MARTALDLTPEEFRNYRPGREWDEKQVKERRDQAWAVARVAARVLREMFGAKRVVVFGSLAHQSWFTPWSDVDLAAWGIPPDQFYRAVAAVADASSDIEVQLVDLDGCLPKLREVIEQQGIDL
jgi:predicted nucleotidyltransferase